MSESTGSIDGLLVLPRVSIHNANSISSPLTWGFPAMSAFLGAMQALERKLPSDIELVFESIGVVCHNLEPQVSEGGYTRSFRLTRNPLEKDGSPPAFVEEGRAHLEASLIFGVKGSACTSPEQDRQANAEQVDDILYRMRIAGGSVLPRDAPARFKRNQPFLVPLAQDSAERRRQFKKVCRGMLPGFALVMREDLLDKRYAELKSADPELSRLDAWLDLSALVTEPVVNTSTDSDTAGSTARWDYRRPAGWIVPIPVGYAALSSVYEPGSVVSARDPSTPFRFVEALYSIGQWISPHRLDSPGQILWYTRASPDEGLYRCMNDYAANLYTD